MSSRVLLSPAGCAASPTLADTLENCRLALAKYAEEPHRLETWRKFLQARREAASAIVLLAGSEHDTQQAETIIELQRKIAVSGVYDTAPEPEDLVLLEQVVASGPLGPVAAMLLVSPSRWPAAPLPLQVPLAYWTAYTAWLFYTPQVFRAAGQANA